MLPHGFDFANTKSREKLCFYVAARISSRFFLKNEYNKGFLFAIMFCETAFWS